MTSDQAAIPDGVTQLAILGMRLHPLVPMNKVPIVKAWQEKATNDIPTLERWAKANEGCNWGMATGAVSGVFVLDIDPKNGGDASWHDLVTQNGSVKAPTVITGSGGLHIYFQYPANKVIRNSASRVGKGIDIRAEGGQVVVPPSIHPNGTTYKWIDGLEPWTIKPPKPPKWLMIKIAEGEAQQEFVAVGDAMVSGERNSNIYHQSLMLARQGALKEIALAAMREWCNTTNNADIEDYELQKTVDSAYKKADEEKAKRAKTQATAGKTDDDNARRLVDAYKDRMRYVSGMGWFVWDGKHWEPDRDDARVLTNAIQCIRALRDEAMEIMRDPNTQKEGMVMFSWATNSLNIGKLHAMVELASKYPEVRCRPDDLDAGDAKWMLNCLNGTVDLRTGKLKPHDKNDLITKLVRHNYNPDAKCPTWEHTFELSFDGNKGLTNFIQRALGYSMSASTSEQCLFICWGEAGNNGKSTFLEGMQRILGEGYIQMSDMKVVTSPEMDNRVASSLAKLVGVRLVSMNEANEQQRLSEALVKQITGGDTVEACFKYREPFNYKPDFKLWIRTNEKPVIRGLNEAIWRRIKLIPFEKSIPKELRKSRDDVDAAIDAEAEGIIAWCVRGFQMWQQGGLQDPPEVTSAVDAYRAEMDIIGSFVAENCSVGDGEGTNWCYRSDIYQAFVTWSKMNGYRFQMTADSFGRRLTKHIMPQNGRERMSGKYIWRGITVTEDAVLNLQER